MRRAGIALVLCAVALGCGGAVRAQGFPSKPVRIVVPFAPGGSPDVLARTVAQKTSENLAQQVIVENRAGATGIIGIEAVINAPPDGYTLLMIDSSAYAINPLVNRNVRYEVFRDLAPLTLAATSPIFLVVNSGLKVASVKEFLALARAKPGLPFGSSGNGTNHHLALELLKSLAGVDLVHVPYKGASLTVPAVVAGDVAAAFAGLNASLPHAKAGKLKMLAVATAQRSALAPDIPTLAEAGVPGFDISITLGFFAPSKTPGDVIDRLNAEFVKALKADDVRKRLLALGVEAVGSTPGEYAEVMRNEIRQYAKLVKAAGVRVD